MVRRQLKFLFDSKTPFSQKDIVFVSYRHMDSDICFQILEHLKQQKYAAVWIDESLTAGEYYDEEIREAMTLSDVMVQIVTENYFTEGSYTMNHELPLAKSMGLRVLPIVCCEDTEKVFPYLQQYTDDICFCKDPHSIAETMDRIHNELRHKSFPDSFSRLTKRMDTWYLTPADMLALAEGYVRLRDSDQSHLIPPQLDEGTAKRYALAASIADMEGAEALLAKLDRREKA